MEKASVRPFRAAWLDDWQTRVVDRMCHITACLLFPGPWWFQFLPDLMVIPMMTTSLITNRFLAKSNPLVRISKCLHNPVWVGVWAIVFFVDHQANNWAFYMLIHWGVHLLIDAYTHTTWREYEKEL